MEQRGVQQFSRYGTGLRQIKNTDPVEVRQAASPDWLSTLTSGHHTKPLWLQPSTPVIRAALKFSPPARLADWQHQPALGQHFAGAGLRRLAPVAHLRHAAHALHADRRRSGDTEAGGGKEGADGPDAGCVGGGADAGAGVVAGGGAGGVDFWRVQGVGAGEWGGSGGSFKGFRKPMNIAASKGLRSDGHEPVIMKIFF